jgi:hypothetical protein
MAMQVERFVGCVLGLIFLPVALALRALGKRVDWAKVFEPSEEGK